MEKKDIENKEEEVKPAEELNDEENCENKKCNCKEHCECDEKDIKIEQLANEILRLKADGVNYRKRKDEEMGKMLEYCNEDIVKDILPIVDNFERAIKLDDDNLEDELSKFLVGFKMIYCHLIEALEKYGVKAIDGVNKEFNPIYHQAVLTEKGNKPGEVIEVLQKGYLLKDKVIRPAMVKVAE